MYKLNTAPDFNQPSYSIALVNGFPSGLRTKSGTCPCGGSDGMIGVTPSVRGERANRSRIPMYPPNAVTIMISNGRMRPDNSREIVMNAGVGSIFWRRDSSSLVFSLLLLFDDASSCCCFAAGGMIPLGKESSSLTGSSLHSGQISAPRPYTVDAESDDDDDDDDDAILFTFVVVRVNAWCDCGKSKSKDEKMTFIFSCEQI